MKRNAFTKFGVYCITALIALSCNSKKALDNHEPWWLDANTLPEWIKDGKTNCTRWDGGPIEAVKGRLSGWPYWEENDPEGVLKTMENFYNEKTIEWIKRAGFNWVWVTWSNGFSHETESKQWEILGPYIKKCHKNGIYVTAYISGANMFKEDMLRHKPESEEWWKLDTNGEPVPYSSGNYKKYGITRYMANTQHPDWLPYQRVRIRKALEAGVDGFWVDNIGTTQWRFGIKQLVDLIMEEGKRLDVTPIVNFNLHCGSLGLGRYMNCIVTEDGIKPGIFKRDFIEKTDISTTNAHEKDLVSIDKSDSLVCNIGLLKYLYAISEGWRPVCLEDGLRDMETNRFTDYMTPELWQLSLAECKMYNGSQAPFFEGIFARDLFIGNQKAFECLDAIGAYNKFFKQNSAYFIKPVSTAHIAVIGQTEDEDQKSFLNSEKPEILLINYLNRLSRFDVQYDVLFNIDLSMDVLKQYEVITLMEWIDLNEIQSGWLKQWVLDGGTLFIFGDKGKRVQMLQTKIKDGNQSLGKGKLYFSKENPTPKELSEKLKILVNNHELITMNAPSYVLHHTVKQRTESRIIVHVINYSGKITSGIEMVSRGPSLEALVLSPDMEKQQLIKGIAEPDGKIRFKLPDIKTYYMVSLSY